MTTAPVKQHLKPLYSAITDWIAGTVGVLTIGGAAIRGTKILHENRRQRQEKQEDEARRRKEREEFIDKLPAMLESQKSVNESVAMAVAQFAKIGETVTRLEDNQIEAKELRRIQAEQSRTAYYRCRPDGRAYEVSQPLCELFGLTEAEMLTNDGAGWVAAIEHPTEAWGHWVASVTNNLPYEDSYVVINRSVKPVTKTKVSTRAWPVRGADGRLMSFYGVVSREDNNAPS
jgi:PAS domain-containing protein